VVKALERLSPDGERPTPRAAQALAETWRPFRAYATLHLWNALT
jgi:3-methyladenine DNA glycosylase/8-oxoguanine DNA glycosylase